MRECDVRRATVRGIGVGDGFAEGCYGLIRPRPLWRGFIGPFRCSSCSPSGLIRPHLASYSCDLVAPIQHPTELRGGPRS